MNPSKKIPLSQGKFATVDDTDYDWLNQWKWHLSHNYAQRSINVKRFNLGKNTETVRMHRQIMGDNSLEVDHINGNKLDNRRNNLRFCTRTENQQNRGVHKNKRYKGVNWHKRQNAWQVSIRVNGKLEHLGYVDNEKAGAALYNQHALINFGNFARLNKI